MRMHKKFSRFKPATPPQVLLGADTVPNAALGADGTPPRGDDTVTGVPLQDNLLAVRFTSSSGEPVRRIAVGYNYRGAGVATTLPAVVWLWDETARRWFQVATGTLTNDQITFFDVVALVDGLYKRSDGTTPSQGGIEAILVVSDNTAPNGEHVFTWGADLSVF